MNFNVYLEDALVRRLQAIAKRTGAPRNALIREAVESWISRPREAWPAAVLEWRGDPTVEPFEDARAELSEPSADPFAPLPRKAARRGRRSAARAR